VLYYGGSQQVIVYDLPDVVAPADPPAPDLPELKQKWSVECKPGLESAAPYFDDDGLTVALVSSTGPLAAAAFRAKDGGAGRELPPPAGGNRFQRLFAVDKDRFGFQTDASGELLVWEPQTGKTTRKGYAAPAGQGGVPSVNVSPNGRYVAVARARPAPGKKAPPESPLKVTDTTTGRPALTLDWHVGATAFTADSSRILVVDDTDRFRWFKLGDKKPEAEWAFDRPPDGRNARLLGVSARGEAILYYGRPPGKEEAVHLLDGKTGAVLHSFPPRRYAATGAAVSDDGGRVMLTAAAEGDARRVEVFDAAGGPLGAAKLPSGPGTAAVSWKARLLVTYDRATRRLTAYELPAAPAP
jgi:DNA-binding beta-propeller fold protein YncE